MARYHVIPFARLDEAIRFRDRLIQLLLEHSELKGVVKSILQPEGTAFKEFEAAFFLNDASFEILSRAGIGVPVLKTLAEDEVPTSGKVDFG